MWKDLARLDSITYRDIPKVRATKNSQRPHGSVPSRAVLAGGEDQSDAPRTPADQGTQGHDHSQGVRSWYLVWLVTLVWPTGMAGMAGVATSATDLQSVTVTDPETCRDISRHL